MTRDDERVFLAAYANMVEAHLTQTKLASEGLDARVHRVSRYRAMGGGGYVVKVAPQDLARARELVGEPGEIDMDEYVDADDPRYRRCPVCNSVNVINLPLDTRGVVFMFLTLGLSLLYFPRDRRCRKCGHRWHG